MEIPPPLAHEFRSRLSARLNIPEDPREVEDLLRRAFEGAKAQWQAVQLSPVAFIRHLARCIPEERAGESLEDVLADLSLSELYLACACALGDERAILELDGHYLSALRGKLAKLDLAEDALADSLQALRETMLVRKGTREPRIGEYQGRGALLNWLKVAATRAALKAKRPGRSDAEDDVSAAIDALPAQGVDAEMDLLKRRYVPHYKKAIRLAFAELTKEERHWLRLHFLDGLSETQMANVLGKSQSTVSRGLKKVRMKAHDLAKQYVKQDLKLSTAEFESMMEDLRSQLDDSISKILGKGEPPEPDR